MRHIWELYQFIIIHFGITCQRTIWRLKIHMRMFLLTHCGWLIWNIFCKRLYKCEYYFVHSIYSGTQIKFFSSNQIMISRKVHYFDLQQENVVSYVVDIKFFKWPVHRRCLILLGNWSHRWCAQWSVFVLLLILLSLSELWHRYLHFLI